MKTSEPWTSAPSGRLSTQHVSVLAPERISRSNRSSKTSRTWRPKPLRPFRPFSRQWTLTPARNTYGGACRVLDFFDSDDAFFHFRGWLLAQGEIIYRRALVDPDSLADVIPDPDPVPVAPGIVIPRPHLSMCEAMHYVAMAAYERRTGKQLPIKPSTTRQARVPSSSMPDWDEDELLARYPRLCAKAGWQMDD